MPGNYKELTVGVSGLIPFYNWDSNDKDVVAAFTTLVTSAQAGRDALRAGAFPVTYKDNSVRFTQADLAACHQHWQVTSSDRIHPIEAYLVSLIKRRGAKDARSEREGPFQRALNECRALVRALDKKTEDYKKLTYLLEDKGGVLSDTSFTRLTRQRTEMAEVIRVPLIYKRDATPIPRKVDGKLTIQTVIDVCFPQLDSSVWKLASNEFPRSLLELEDGGGRIRMVKWDLLKKAYSKQLKLFRDAAIKAGCSEAVIPPPNAFLSALRKTKTLLPSMTDDLYAKQQFAQAVSELNAETDSTCKLVIACLSREIKQVRQGIIDGGGNVTLLLDVDMNSYQGAQNNPDLVATCNMGHPSHAMGNGGYSFSARSGAEEAYARVSGGTVEAVCDNPLKFAALRAAAGLPKEPVLITESASVYLKIMAWVLGATSAALLVVGALAVASMIASIAPPIGLAMSAAGIAGLAVSGGLFSSKQKPEPMPESGERSPRAARA